MLDEWFDRVGARGGGQRERSAERADRGNKGGVQRRHAAIFTSGHGRAAGRIGSNTPMKPVNPNGGLVYSTDAGRMCPACRQPIAQCACKKAVAPPTDGVVRVFFETKGRGGKGVTVVRGLGLAEAELTVLGKKLKAACGVGGTAKEGVVELQGDHRDRVMALLQAQGFKNVKKAGG